MIETVVPEFLIAVEPLIGVAHRLGAQLARDDAAQLVARDQARIRQHVEMLHHRRQRHRKWFGELTDRQAVGPAQFGEQRAARRIGQRGKGAVERLGSIVNHVVKYKGGRRGVKRLRRLPFVD